MYPCRNISNFECVGYDFGRDLGSGPSVEAKVTEHGHGLHYFSSISFGRNGVVWTSALLPCGSLSFGAGRGLPEIPMGGPPAKVPPGSFSIVRAAMAGPHQFAVHPSYKILL